MTYRGPKESCPHFDEALSQFDSLAEEIRDVIQQRARNHESEIEKAREINATLRDDNFALTDRVEALEEENNELRSQIQALREDS